MALRNRTAVTTILNQENVKNSKSTAVLTETRRLALGEIGNRVTVRTTADAKHKGIKLISKDNPKLLTKTTTAKLPEQKPNVQTLKSIIKKSSSTENDNNNQLSQIELKQVQVKVEPISIEVKVEPVEVKLDHKPVLNDADIALKNDNDAFSSNILEIEDIDEADRKNPILVTIYSNDIYNYLRELEIKFPIREKYLENQEVTPNMRSVLIDWLIEVHQQFHLLQETLYLTVAIIDRFLQDYRKITRKRLQLVGVSALFIACKYEEMYAPDITDFVYITDNAYTKTEILQMEMLITRTLDFSFGRPLPLHFLRRYSKAGRALPVHHTMAKYFLENSLVHYSMCHYSPSIIAAAALYLALYVVGSENDDSNDQDKLIWNRTLIHYSTYSKEQLLPIVFKIAALITNVEKSKFQAVRKKYQLSKNMRISLRTELKSPSMVLLANRNGE